jgi:hypothetical protein
MAIGRGLPFKTLAKRRLPDVPGHIAPFARLGQGFFGLGLADNLAKVLADSPDSPGAVTARPGDAAKANLWCLRLFAFENQGEIGQIF